MKNLVNMTAKETNKAPITDPKEMDISELSDREFRIILLKKFSELQAHTDNKIRKTIHEQNEKLSKEIGTIKKKKQKQNPKQKP